MSGILKFLKQRWLPIVCVVVVLGALPTAWIFSNKWNEEILKTAEAGAGDKLNQIKRARVTYVIPSVVPGQQDTTVTDAPNAAMTQWVADQRRQRVEQAGLVMTEATKRNKASHGPLVEGLYPEGPGNDSQLKRQMREYLEFMLGDARAGKPSWYTRTLREAGAGTVPNAGEIAQMLAETKDREEAIAAAESDDGRVDAERQQQINESLVSRRIGEYRRHAQGFSFYADQSVLGGHTFFPPPSMEARSGAQVPLHEEGFMWMADAWVLEDILRAIETANTGVGGEQTEVELSPVKRIVKLEIDQLPIFSKGSGEPAGLISRDGRAPLDPNASITGRVSSSENSVYDVRKVRLELIVSSEKLPSVIEAFHSTGLMTVTDLDLDEIDIWDDLSLGYAYGNEHVVKASMDIEIVWLRSWTVPLMPKTVQQVLGVNNNG